METVVVLVTGSGQARGACAMLRRLVMRLLLLTGFTAAGWLASVLLMSGTASADLIKLPELPGITSAPQQSAQQQSAPQQSAQQSTRQPAKPAKKVSSGQGGGLVGGLLGGVVSTVNTTVSTVTTTVTNTVNTVTKTVTSTVSGVKKTVTTVVDRVTDSPQSTPGDDGDNSLLPEPVVDLLTPDPKSDTDTTTDSNTARGTVETTAAEVPAPVVAATEPPAPAVTEAPVTERPRVQHHEVRRTQATAHPVRVGSIQEKVAPADKSPGPMPGPSAPVAPAAPAPTASAGGNGGSDARGLLAVLTPHSALAPPQAGLVPREHTRTETGRCAGLPATAPD